MNMSEAARQMSEHEKLIAEWSTERTVYIEAIQRLQTESNRCRLENAKLKETLADIAKSAFTCPGTPLVCSCAEHKAARALSIPPNDPPERNVTGMYD